MKRIIFILVLNHHLENCRVTELQNTHQTLWKIQLLHWAMYHCALCGLLGMRSNRPLGSQSSLTLTAVKERLQIKLLQGSLLHSRGWQARYCREINDLSSVIPPCLWGWGNVQGGERLMIIRLQKSILGVPSDGSNCSFCWEDENPCVQKT